MISASLKSVRIMVTRVQPQAQAWAQSFKSHGFDAVALPLIAVAPAADTQAIAQAWSHLSDYVGVMFVSGHAVNYFFASNKALKLDEKALEAINSRFWATGPGTLSALLAQGVASDLIDAPAMDAAQFDSEALWLKVQGLLHPGGRVLIVRGDAPQVPIEGGAHPGVGRDWFAGRVQEAGAQVDFVVAYQRSAPLWSPAQLALAKTAATDGSVWLFSSSESLLHLQALLPQQDWHHARAVATHKRIARAASDLGFLQVAESKPTFAAVLSSIESLA